VSARQDGPAIRVRRFHAVAASPGINPSSTPRPRKAQFRGSSATLGGRGPERPRLRARREVTRWRLPRHKRHPGPRNCTPDALRSNDPRCLGRLKGGRRHRRLHHRLRTTASGHLKRAQPRMTTGPRENRQRRRHGLPARALGPRPEAPFRRRKETTSPVARQKGSACAGGLTRPGGRGRTRTRPSGARAGLATATPSRHAGFRGVL